MSLLDQYLSAAPIRQVHHVAVTADPARAWAVVRQIDANRIGFVRRLFALRVLPDRVARRLRGRPLPAVTTARIDDLTGPESGFQILDETPGREVVVGAIGKPWELRIPFVAIAPSEFAEFDERGFAKIAWSLRVDPREGGAWITFDLRVATTDPESMARFQRYWQLIGRFSHAMREAVMALFVRELGAAPPLEPRPLPGDHLYPEARFQKTHEVIIEAPPSAVWPWLLQMGARRAGWYSWDLLDNGGTPSAHRIHPELQHLAVGDTIRALPWGSGAFKVLEIEPGRSLVLGSDGGTSHTSWAFVLEPIGDDATRLHVRIRVSYEPSRKMSAMLSVIAPIHEVMERRQLHNLKQRAEARVR